MSLASDLRLIASLLRTGCCTTAEQFAAGTKLAEIATRVARVEVTCDELVADAMAEARDPKVVDFPRRAPAVLVHVVGDGS